ncbi:TetR/AcrR family transcriptional regulator [Caballeronia fortuita]|uniref:TetR/AcrR family transcriptional regulator n=1 Tax=Caballeronia fortuita TaxID=1777138 RepID=UPI001FC94FAF|nr:TetR/AcrR family transcriptional regulator [Caballeronia fortuita]
MLDAAASSIAEKGFAATSVEDIAARAGYTRGAFYSHYSSTCDVFAELLLLRHQNERDDLQALLDAASFAEDLQSQLTLLNVRRHGDSDSYLIWAEARMHALRDATFRQRINVLFLERRDIVGRLIGRFRDRLNRMPPGSSDDQAVAAIALLKGIAYFNMTMPEKLPNVLAIAIIDTVFVAAFLPPSYD